MDHKHPLWIAIVLTVAFIVLEILQWFVILLAGKYGAGLIFSGKRKA
ncbi:MAG: hypothetical protein LHV68_05190 [Elusimicrobia bacterium]|nr:hypothetical protein [Candidatus Liberimonas magnetica]